MHYLYYFFFTLILYLQVFILKHSNLALVVMTQWLTYSWEITPALGLIIVGLPGPGLAVCGLVVQELTFFFFPFLLFQ